jgi:hypothetical protein
MKKIIAVVVVVLAGVCFAQSPRQVEVVAEVSLTNQTGTITGTLYTPPQTGVFRVNFMFQCTGDQQNSGTLQPAFIWTDDNGEEFYELGQIPCGNIGRPASFIFIIKATAEKPINWFLREGGSQGTSTYDVYMALERIGPTVQ